jgi:hypothetical protein
MTPPPRAARAVKATALIRREEDPHLRPGLRVVRGTFSLRPFPELW